MAKVQVEEIVDHLSYEFKKALEDAVERTYSGITVDRNALFREFQRAVRRKFNTWEQVPDQYVDVK